MEAAPESSRYDRPSLVAARQAAMAPKFWERQSRKIIGFVEHVGSKSLAARASSCEITSRVSAII